MKNWEDALVGPDTPLEDAIGTLDRSGLRIVLVADEHRRLLGTVTDGDVRRALLKHLSLDRPVREVMCSTPQTARRSWNKERILAVMEGKQLLQLPVVDDEGRVVGLDTLHDLLGRNRLNNPVFLMAGGFGTRLYPLTSDCPKPMLKVGDKPILEIILEGFIKSGFHRFFISTHYLPDMIRQHFGDGSKWGVSIRYIHEETPLGTGGALGLLPHDEIDSSVLMMNGDLLTTLDYRGLLDFHHEHGGIATMCVRNYEYQIPYGVIQTDGHRVTAMIEKPTQHHFINAGIYALSPALISTVDPHQRIDLPTLLEQQISNGKDVTMFPIHEYWLDIGKMDDFRRAQDEVRGLFR